MSDTNLINTTHAHPPADHVTHDANENQGTSALATAYPNATVTQAHTPARADATQAVSQADVEETLSTLIGGRGPKSARGKAEKLIRHLPADARTPVGLQNLADAFENHSDEVRRLLHSTHEDFPSSESNSAGKRRELRKEILHALARGRTVEQAQHHKNHAATVLHLADALSNRSIIGGSRFAVKNRASTLAYHLANKLHDQTLLTNLKGAIANDPDRVGGLLRFSDRELIGNDARLDAQALLLSMISKGRTPEEIDRVRENICGVEYPTSVVNTDAEFADASKCGTPVTPLALDYVGADSRPIMQRALGNGDAADQDLRVASTKTTLGATRPDFLMTHSLAPCQPVIIFWKDSDNNQNATLFHFSSAGDIEGYKRYLKAIDPDMKIDSVNWVKREAPETKPTYETRNGKLVIINESYERALRTMANELCVPLNIINRPSKESDVDRDGKRAYGQEMAVAVDVERAKIVFMKQDTMYGPDQDRDIDYPWPTRLFNLYRDRISDEQFFAQLQDGAAGLVQEESVNLDRRNEEAFNQYQDDIAGLVQEESVNLDRIVEENQ